MYKSIIRGSTGRLEKMPMDGTAGSRRREGKGYKVVDEIGPLLMIDLYGHDDSCLMAISDFLLVSVQAIR